MPTEATRTAENVIGGPSLYTRGRNTPGVTTRSRGARLNGYVYDEKHHRLFARDYTEYAWQPHGRIMVFDVHPDRIKNGPKASAVIGQPDFTSHKLGFTSRQRLGSIGPEAFDEENQRLFITDDANNRVMVYDVHPDRMDETPAASWVLGQDDFTSGEAGAGADRFNGPGDLYYDEATDRLFVTDEGNNRVLIFDAAPDRLETGMEAEEVLGQPDFESAESGTAADRFAGPGELAFDERTDRLFVDDGGNNRLLVFDGSPQALTTDAEATHVLGQDDFTSREERTDPRKWAEGLVLEEKTQRLFANEGDRLLVFDIHPERLTNNPDATNLMFKEDWQANVGQEVEGLGIVSRTKETAVKEPMIDSETQTMYTATSFPGRNAVSIWDIAPDNMRETGTPVADVLGQYDWAGNVDFNNRAANGRAGPRWNYPRGVALDPVDHRLFVVDQYLHRVAVYELDAENRLVDREADVILGQPHAYTGTMRPISARHLNIPLNLAYDPEDKQLFVADGGNNRILVFNAAPKELGTYDKAAAVIGQQDFTSRERELSADSINFGVAYGRGITSTNPTPIGFAVDAERRRLFVSDGLNNRVLAFNIEQIENGEAASGVIGQPDFESNDPGAGANGFNVPSGLDYDPEHERLFVADGDNNRALVFDASPEAIEAGKEALAVLGQDDFESTEEVRLDTQEVTEEVGRTRMRMPSGAAYDGVRDELYVNDKGNDRILVFNAAPKELETGMAAHGVVGQPDFVTRIPGDGEQEQLLDPRQLAFDEDNRRLYVADSFWGRVMMFDLPRAEREVALPGHGTRTYGTLDAWNNRGQPENPRLGMPREDKRRNWSSTIEAAEGGVPGAQLVYHTTRQERDPMSLRRSRTLLSETRANAPKPSTSALFFAASNEGTQSKVVVNNPNRNTVKVAFEFHPDEEPGLLQRIFGNGGGAEAERKLGAGETLTIALSELFRGDVEGAGTLRLDAKDEVASHVLQQTTTERDEKLLTAAPGGPAPAPADKPAALPGLRWGGGYATELVLLNPHEEPISGEVAFYDRDGEPIEVKGGDHRLSYEIEPNGTFRWQRESEATWAQEAYAVVESEDPLPAGGAQVSLSRDTQQITQTNVPLRATTQHATVPVDTKSSLIRHGRTQMDFTITNPTRRAAVLRFTLFDASGEEKGQKVQRVLPPDTQRSWGLADLFNRQQFDGSVRLSSDVAVAVGAERTTDSLRPISTERDEELLAAAPDDEPVGALPGLRWGGGYATELVLRNPHEEPISGEVAFYDRDGKPIEVKGGDHRLSYEIEPNGTFRWQRESEATWAQEAYAVVESEDFLPAGGAQVSLSRDTQQITQTNVPLRETGHHATQRVNTQSGRTQMDFTITNPTRTPATLRFTLFDASGEEKGRYEQVLPPLTQRSWGLADLFNRQQFNGSVRLWSDVAVAVGADERTTESLRHEPVTLGHEPVTAQVGYVTEQQLQGNERAALPGILDGEGIATETVFINPSEEPRESHWQFFSAEGEAEAIRLR